MTSSSRSPTPRRPLRRSFSYTPSANYNGPDSFTYKANDGTIDGNTVTVSLTVTAVADTPAASADAYGVGEDVVLAPNAADGVLGDDSDGDGGTLHAALGTAPSHGQLQLADDGSFTYTPATNFTGDDGFTYTASDGVNSSAATAVTIRVIPTSGTDPDQWVTDAYQVLLHRTPDAGGLGFWSARLSAGMTRDAIAQRLIRSTESSNLLIRSAYLQLLDRPTDAGGLAYWRTFLDNGGTYQALKARLAGSPEFFAAAGGTNADFVDSAYLALLGRAAESGGSDAWVARLESGQTRTRVASSILVSAEGRRAQLKPLYVLVLLRALDNSDFASVGPGLVTGDWRTAAAGLVGSDEFFALATVDPSLCDLQSRC